MFVSRSESSVGASSIGLSTVLWIADHNDDNEGKEEVSASGSIVVRCSLDVNKSTTRDQVI